MGVVFGKTLKATVTLASGFRTWLKGTACMSGKTAIVMKESGEVL